MRSRTHLRQPDMFLPEELFVVVDVYNTRVELHTTVVPVIFQYRYFPVSDTAGIGIFRSVL
jgi:hypothetical protein